MRILIDSTLDLNVVCIDITVNRPNSYAIWDTLCYIEANHKNLRANGGRDLRAPAIDVSRDGIDARLIVPDGDGDYQ